MRFAVSSEQHKFFREKGYLELQGLLTLKEAFFLMTLVKEVGLKTPGYPPENLFRSIPLIADLAKKRGWGQIAAELLNKKPVHIAYDQFFFSSPLVKPVDDESCGLLIDLSSFQGIFFKNVLPDHLYNPAGACYFLEMTTRRLSRKFNPVVA